MKQPCWKCGGTGIVRNEESTVYETVCPICRGTMYLDDMVYKGPTIDDIIATQLEGISGYAKNIDNHNSLVGITKRVERLEKQLEAIAGLIGEKDEYVSTKTTTCAQTDELSCED